MVAERVNAMTGDLETGWVDAGKASLDISADDTPASSSAVARPPAAMTEGTNVTLFVTDDAPRSRRARANLVAAIQTLGRGLDDIREVDVLRNPQVALAHGVFAVPALMRGDLDYGGPVMYGDLSEAAKLTAFLQAFVSSDSRKVRYFSLSSLSSVALRVDRMIPPPWR